VDRKRVALVAIGLAAAIAVVGGGYGMLAGSRAEAPVTGSRGEGAKTASATTAEPACGTSRGQPSGAVGTVASKAPWHVRLGPGESLEPTRANVEASRRGRPMVISGRVLAARCATPVAGATVHVWQTNGDGDYGPGQGTEQIRCCYLQGTMTTDPYGRYEFESVRPGNYSGTPHLHVVIRAPDGRGLQTEVGFAADPGAGAGGGPVLHLAERGGRLRASLDLVLG
jgi:hypothetical protein